MSEYLSTHKFLKRTLMFHAECRLSSLRDHRKRADQTVSECKGKGLSGYIQVLKVFCDIRIVHPSADQPFCVKNRVLRIRGKGVLCAIPDTIKNKPKGISLSVRKYSQSLRVCKADPRRSNSIALIICDNFYPSSGPLNTEGYVHSRSVGRVHHNIPYGAIRCAYATFEIGWREVKILLPRSNACLSGGM